MHSGKNVRKHFSTVVIRRKSLTERDAQDEMLGLIMYVLKLSKGKYKKSQSIEILIQWDFELNQFQN